MKNLLAVSVLVAGFAFAGSSAEAAPLFYSGDGGDILVSSVVPGVVTTIAKHSVWGDVSPDAGLAADTARWISYANTGAGGSIAPNIADIGAPGGTDDRVVGNQTAHFRRTFNGVGTFNFWILADDTATVILDGVTLFSAYTGQIDPCAPGGSGVPIGCVKADMGTAAVALAAGAHVLDIYVFQTNRDVFGTQYAGAFKNVVDPQDVPEPASMALLGLGLLGAGIARRRK